MLVVLVETVMAHTVSPVVIMLGMGAILAWFHVVNIMFLLIHVLLPSVRRHLLDTAAVVVRSWTAALSVRHSILIVARLFFLLYLTLALRIVMSVAALQGMVDVVHPVLLPLQLVLRDRQRLELDVHVALLLARVLDLPVNLFDPSKHTSHRLLDLSQQDYILVTLITVIFLHTIVLVLFAR